MGIPRLTAPVVASAAAWLYLATARGGFWRTTVLLPPTGEVDQPTWPALAVVVPARDESAMIEQTLPGLLGQPYDGPCRILLVDDNSDDDTAATARRVADRHPDGARLEVVSGAPRPPGWTGKVWALHQGLERVGADCPFALFTDADIAHTPGTFRRLVGTACRDDRDVVSVMARLNCESRWERLLVPAFDYFFRQLYPFRWVGDDRRRTAAAAGGCLLVRRSALDRSGGLAAMRDALIDDVALARLVKRGGRGGGGRVWLGHSPDVVSRRQYSTLADLWDMVARSADTQLRHSLPLLLATVGGLVGVYLVPPVAAVSGLKRLLAGSGRADRSMLVAASAAWATMTATYVPTVGHYELRPWRAFGLPAAAALYLAMTVDSAVRHRRGQGARWKGRAYPGGGQA